MSTFKERCGVFWKLVLNKYGTWRVLAGIFMAAALFVVPFALPFGWARGFAMVAVLYGGLFLIVRASKQPSAFQRLLHVQRKKKTAVKMQAANEHQEQNAESFEQSDSAGEKCPDDMLVIDTTKPITELTVDELTQMMHGVSMSARVVVSPSPTSNDTVYWDKNPHIKHFLKRLWRIATCWLLIIALTVACAQSSSLTVWTAVVPLLLTGVMYTLRRIKKWKDLRLSVVGNWVIIQEAKSRLFFLNGQRRQVPVSACDNISSKQTTVEQWFRLDCGKIDINTPIDKDDWFRFLEDVRDYEEFERLVRARHDEFMLAASRGFVA